MTHRLLSWIIQDNLDWDCLSETPAAIQLLEANQDRINWSYLSENPAAIHLLETNQDKINWTQLSTNPAIFELNYQTLSIERSALIKDELMTIALRPERVARWYNSGYDIRFC